MRRPWLESSRHLLRFSFGSIVFSSLAQLYHESSNPIWNGTKKLGMFLVICHEGYFNLPIVYFAEDV